MTSDKARKPIRWTVRAAIALALVVAAMYGVLSLAARSKEPIRMGLEDYIEEFSGQDATITDLTHVKLVPDILFNMNGIFIRDRKDSDKTLVKINQFHSSMPLWRMMVGAQEYLGFEARGVEVATGYILPRKLTLEFAGITDPKPAEADPQFVMEGEYNAQDILITAEMIRRKKARAPLYRFGHAVPFTFKIGKIEGAGTLERGWNDVTLRGVKMYRTGKEAEFTVTGIDGDDAKIAGTIDGVAFTGTLSKGAEGSAAVTITPASISAEENKKVADFIDALRGDLGLDDTYKKLTIETTQGTDTP